MTGLLDGQSVLVVGRAGGIARAVAVAARDAGAQVIAAGRDKDTLASARARGRLADLDREAVRLSFDTKVIGPLMLAKHLAPRMTEAGSFVIFSGVAAVKITAGTLGVAVTNGAADVLARSLALELAPIRVNAVSPGVIDTGAWDALGEQGKADYFAEMSARNPARRVGTAADVADAVLYAMTSTFLTGQTLHIDGGEPLS